MYDNLQNGVKVIDNPPGQAIFENSNPIRFGNILIIMLSAHPVLSYNPDGTPEKVDYAHENTRMMKTISTDDGVTWSEPVFMFPDFMHGIEDTFLTELNSGLFLLDSELKVKGGEQWSICTHTTLDFENYLYHRSLLKPLGTGWQAGSISSPANWFEGGKLYKFYEGRGLKADGNIDAKNFKTGLAIFKSDGITLEKRFDNPLIDDFVGNDITFKDGWYYFAGHTFKADWIGERWRGVIYKSQHLESGWQFLNYTKSENGYPSLHFLKDSEDVYGYAGNYNGWWKWDIDGETPPPVETNTDKANKAIVIMRTITDV
ncbi:MAG: hypothetical protein GWP19_03800 [Planctomycetia bacterium]|nr:hypothetical protein [Planctomycetia bacterium]